MFWIHIKEIDINMFIFFYCYIFISKKDNNCMIFELQLLNLAAFDFETYRKSFEHGLSIDKKRFVCSCEYFK